MNTSTTEKQVIEFIAAQAKRLSAEVGSSLVSVTVEAHHYGAECGDHGTISLRIYTHDAGSITDCATLAEGAERIIARSAPAALADRKRKHAAELLAEAAALENRSQITRQ